MAAVPSTVGRPALRPPTGAAARLRLVSDRKVLNGQILPIGRTAQQKAAARRRLGTLAAVCGLVGLWFGTGALAGSQTAAPKTAFGVAPGAVYVVRVGDTLQSIAERLVPRREIPQLVHSLAKELHGDPLRPGRVLRIP